MSWDIFVQQIPSGADSVGDIPDGFVLHVFAGELSVHVVTDILQTLGLRALDPSSRSGLFEPASAAADFSRWREYRDQLVRRGSN